MRPSVITVLVLSLLLSLSQGEVWTIKNGKDHVMESTLAIGAVFTEGERHCGTLYPLNVTAGCIVANPPFSEAFNATYGSFNTSLDQLIPFLDFRSGLIAGCKSYAQVFKQLFPALETIPVASRPKVFLTGSVILNFIGFGYEPFGELDYQTLPYRFVTLPYLNGIEIVLGEVSPQVCVVVKYGFFSRYFIGIGHYFTMVILGSINAVCLILNCCEVFQAVRKQNLFRLTMFSFASFYSFFRLVDYFWDHRNFHNYMGDHAYQALLWGGFMSVYITNFSLVYMWLSAIRTGSLSSHLSPTVSKIAAGIIVVTCTISVCVCIIGAFTSTNTNLLNLYTGSFFTFVILDFTVVVFFVSFGIRVLLLIREALQIGKNLLILKITIAMIVCSLSFFCLTLCAAVYTFFLKTLTPMPGYLAFGLNVCWEVFPVVIILSVTVPFSSLPVMGTSWSRHTGSLKENSEMRERSATTASKPRVHEEKELSFIATP